MYFVKKFLGYGDEAPPSHDFTEFQNFAGQADLYRISLSDRSLTLKDCKVEFSQSETVPFEYQIFCSPKSKQKEKAETNYSFPIHLKMNLKNYYHKKDGVDYMGLLFDLDAENQLNLEFSNENHGLVDAVIFKELLCKLIFETKFQLPYKKAQKEEDYLGFVSPIESPFVKPALNYPSLEEYKDKEPSLPKELPVDFINLSKLLSTLSEEKGVLLCNAGGLYSMDSSENYQLINQAVILALRDMTEFKYQLEVYNSSKTLLHFKTVTNELNYHIDVDNNLFKWVDVTDKGIQLLAIKFDAYNVTKTLKFLMNKCAFEAQRKEFLHEAIKKEDQIFTTNMFTQQKMEIDPQVREEYKQDADMGFLEEGPFVSFKASPEKSDSPFTGMAQAKVLDRTFLTKGDIVSVYKTEEQIEHVSDYDFIQSFEKMRISPKKLLLHEQDTKMLLLDEKDEKKVFYVDIEKGKVIQEIQPDEFNRITSIAPESKQASLTPNSVFLGMNERNIFKLDPRVKSNEAAVAKKIYSQTNYFTTITSNMYGNFAIGSEKGEIRLFKEVGKNAVNLYPGLGDPIIDLDSTKDGRFLLATCKNYLVLLPVFSEGKSGFTHQIKNVDKEKATPRILRLLPKTLLKFNIKEVNFKNGRFDENEKAKEKYIVVSTEDLLVSWTLKNVIANKVHSYQLKKVNDKVVGNEFKYNNEDKVMVIMPKELAVHKTLKIKESEEEEEKE